MGINEIDRFIVVTDGFLQLLIVSFSINANIHLFNKKKKTLAKKIISNDINKYRSSHCYCLLLPLALFTNNVISQHIVNK